MQDGVFTNDAVTSDLLTHASAWFPDDAVMGDTFFSGFCSDSRHNLLNAPRNLKDPVVCSLSEAKQSQSKHLRC